jgi:hypothetical protein
MSSSETDGNGSGGGGGGETGGNLSKAARNGVRLNVKGDNGQ